jgi:hypothetical protein
MPKQGVAPLIVCRSVRSPTRPLRHWAVPNGPTTASGREALLAFALRWAGPNPVEGLRQARLRLNAIPLRFSETSLIWRLAPTGFPVSRDDIGSLYHAVLLSVTIFGYPPG